MTKPTIDLNARARMQREQQNAEGAPNTFGAPLTDPRAIGYALAAEARRTGGLPKCSVPVAGGKAPPIPALEHPHQDGMTMAEQAAWSRGDDTIKRAQGALAAQAAASSIIAPDTAMPAPAPRLALSPSDILPEEAVKDPAFRQGAGSRVAVLQPDLAAKYGVIRNNQHISPAALAGVPGAPTGTAQRRSAREISADIRLALEAESSSARAPSSSHAAEEKKVEADAPADADEGEGKGVKSALLDSDLTELGQAMIRDVLRNPNQRRLVEERCKPLSLEDLIMHNVVRQRVPIIPGRFEPTFESVTGEIEMAIKRVMFTDAKSMPTVTEAYLVDKFAVLASAAGTVKINDRDAPAIYNDKGELVDDLLIQRFNWLLRRPTHMIASIGIHYAWFEERVRRLFVCGAEEGKGG